MYVVKSAQETDTSLPQPCGYQILIEVPNVNEKTAGGVYMPDSITDREKTASIVGKVISLGPDAYNDQKKFPSGPWCQAGDFVLFRSYSGTRFRIDGVEYRLINDDSVNGTIGDISKIERA